MTKGKGTPESMIGPRTDTDALDDENKVLSRRKSTPSFVLWPIRRQVRPDAMAKIR
jgi:hypothetical protein